jgi:hypothetical protein
MELNTILQRFAEGLEYVDANTTHASANRRSGEVYLPGVKTLTERQFVLELTNWWKHYKSIDFNPRNAIDLEVPYRGIPRAKCDLVMSTNGSPLQSPEWAIEVKHIALVGNNGKNNDYGVAKILSPYLKDRSLIHDIYRMQKHGVAQRKAVIGYCFVYDHESCQEAKRRHPESIEFIKNIEGVLQVNDPEGRKYSVMPMVEFANDIFYERKLVHNLEVIEFSNAWRHPCGGKGIVFGWELKPL